MSHPTSGARRFYLFVICLVTCISLSVQAHAQLVPLHTLKSVEGWQKDVGSPQPKQQLLAITCLGSYGAKAAGALPALYEQLHSTRSIIRSSSLQSIVDIRSAQFEDSPAPKSRDRWLATLKLNPQNVQAVYALGKLGANQSLTNTSLRALTGALSGPDLALRYFALRAIRGIIESAPYGKDELAADEKRAQILHLWRAQAQICLPALVQATQSGNGLIVSEAVGALGSFSNGSGYESDIVKPAMPAIIAVLRSGNRRLTWEAAWAIDRLGKPAASAVPALIEALRSIDSLDHDHDQMPELRSFEGLSDNEPQRMLIQALGSIGPSARVALPLVTPALQSKDARLRKAAIETVDETGCVRYVTNAFLHALADPDAEIRSISAFALGKVGDQGARVVPGLTKVLTDADSQVRFAACCSLRDLAPLACSSLPALKRRLQDKDSFVKSAAQEAVTAIERRTSRVATAGTPN